VQREIYIDSVPGEVRVALVEDGLLAEVLIERPGARGVAGNIYLGRVRTILPGLQAAFVDLGLERDGFLYVEDAAGPARPLGEDQLSGAGTVEPPGPDGGTTTGLGGATGPEGRSLPERRIEDCLKEGQEIVVQVTKEPMGQKGVRITTHLALPGRLLVFLPGVDHIGVSRRIEAPDERERLRALVREVATRLEAPGGFIVRTNGLALAAGEFVPDARVLLDSWESIRVRRGRSAPPVLLHEEAGAVTRALRDLFDEDVRDVVVDAPALLREAIAFAERARPALARRIRLHEARQPLFEELGLEVQIDRALRPKVWLKSGGYIVINQTEALVAIDVNTGKYVGRERHEETIVRTNLEAVREIVRQIRLRDLGGIIVIDLIDMADPGSRSMLVTALEQELRKDRARSRVLQISEFGLVEITRQRTRPGLDGVLCRPCPACGGAGRAKSVDTLGFEIVRETRKLGAALGAGRVVVRVHPDAGMALRERSAALAAAGNLPAGRLMLEDDAGLRPDQWVLRVD